METKRHTTAVGEEIKREIRKYFEVNENEGATKQNLRDAAQAVST